MFVGLIYGKITGLLRRVVHPDRVGQLPLYVGTGEALITITDQQYATFSGLASIQSYINTITGNSPSDYHSAMIDQAYNAVSVHHADPGCDFPHPGHQLIFNDQVRPGWLFVDNQFIQLPPISPRVFKSPRLLR
jgi:hypothetical protein